VKRYLLHHIPQPHCLTGSLSLWNHVSLRKKGPIVTNNSELKASPLKLIEPTQSSNNSSQIY
jgi:hypothetical protein